MKIIFAVLLVLAFSCNSSYTPKPTGYFKIDFPEREYRSFDEPGYPYTFEYPVYAEIVKDSTFFEDVPENPFWINVDFPQFNGRFYISYKDVKKNSFDKLVADAFNMAYKQHTLKASAIDDSLMHTGQGLSGIFFKLSGNAATGRQFFITDSINHFLRGALYFDATPNEDSLRIVNDFLETDMAHLINTLKWK
ncbi:MAG TPA: hypothetical protein VIK74_09255 [Parasegetibacter sp.]|jgi:gliding motility-associated lipoprotein GldD